MRRLARVLAVAGLGGGLAVIAPPSPASAQITVTVVSGAVTVTANQPGPVTLQCSPDGFMASGVQPSAPLPCASVTSVTVNGDSTAQTVEAVGLNNSGFTKKPPLTVNLGGGDDTVYDPITADTLNLGTGSDAVSTAARGEANTLVDLGSGVGTDSYLLDGTPALDTMTATSTGASLSIHVTNATSDRTHVVSGAEVLELRGQVGNDVISTAGVTAASTIAKVTLDGSDGNDILTGGVADTSFLGGSGSNAMNGDAGDDTFISGSDVDTIHPAGGTNAIEDTGNLRSGSRVIVAAGGDDRYRNTLGGRDVTFRVHQGATATSAVTTASLDRPGQQQLGATITDISARFAVASEKKDRGLADVTALTGNKTVHITGDPYLDDLADVTVPTGTWTTSGTPGAGDHAIDPDTAGYGTVTISSISNVLVHGPWASKNQSFAHRITRDLLFRFPSATARDQLAAQLTAGTKTRAQVVASLINTDEYRGLDVDRVFMNFLRRTSDPGGRTYWINGLRNGKSLLKFRAQLFGSNEYFTKAGGTNGQYVVKAYEDVLGRTPDAAGETYWTNKIKNGANRGAVALQFLSSTEARRAIVKEQFLRLVDRLPTTGEVDFWVPRLSGTTGEQDLIAALAGGAEYLNRS